MARTPTMTQRVGVAYNINTLNNLAMRSGQKPLTPEQLKNMSSAEVNRWIKTVKKVNRLNRRDRRSSSKTFRDNAKAIASENLKQSQLMHGTIRQGLAELGTLGTEAIGGAFAANYGKQGNAITQNTQGGTVSAPVSDDEETENPEMSDGPINKGKRFSYSGRREG